MNLRADVAGRMEYIQKLFLDVERSIERIIDADKIIAALDKEPPEYRSVAYESASMVIGLRDLLNYQALEHWKVFRRACSTQHTFHNDIGLGWAFAKSQKSPATVLGPVNPTMKRMVFDGIGYYYGLFKGRDTIKNKLIPGQVEADGLSGFDQGLGRRLWYIAKGNVDDLFSLVNTFDAARRASMWRGVGIACGYVGGNNENGLKALLAYSGQYCEHFRAGIILAIISRMASDSINPDVKLASGIIFNKKVGELPIARIMATHNFDYLYKQGDDGDWLSQFISEPGKLSNQTSPFLS